MTITLCNSHPFTFYLPFHTSLRADQCPIQSHVPSTCTLGLDPCARHSLFGRTDPYYIDNFYSSCGLKRLAATLASPFSVIVLSSQYLFQRGPIWVCRIVLACWHAYGRREFPRESAMSWQAWRMLLERGKEGWLLQVAWWETHELCIFAARWQHYRYSVHLLLLLPALTRFLVPEISTTPPCCSTKNIPQMSPCDPLIFSDVIL